MANSGNLLAGGILLLLSLYLFLTPSTVFDPAEANQVIDRYPDQGGNFSQNGTLSGQMVEETEGTLTLSASGTGTYLLDKMYVTANDSLRLQNVIVDSTFADSNDVGELRVFGLNDDGVIVESETIQLNDGRTQYGLDEEIQSEQDYAGYQFELLLESSDNQVPEVTQIDLEYNRMESLTESEWMGMLVPFIMFISGIIVIIWG